MARVWLAPVGTVAPAGPTVAMPAGWWNVGLFTPESLKFKTDPKFSESKSHQSDWPTRTWQTEDAGSCEVDLQEWNARNYIAAFGGGTITTVAGPPAYYQYTPPSVGGRGEVAACIEIADGSRHWRRMIPRCMQNEGVEQDWSKTKESTLALRLKILGGDLVSPWYDFSDDSLMAPPEED
ncbi:hypothetical protein GCM10022221_68720 [Actinocorallia aurea]